MAEARLRIEVAGLPNVPDGEARNDGVSGSLVTLTSIGTGNTTHQLRLVSTTDLPPPALNQVNATTWDFTPSAGPGHVYFFELECGDGVNTEIRRRTYRIPTANLGLLVPAPMEAADPTASLFNNGAAIVDASHDNAGGNYFGWAPRAEQVFRQLDAFARGYDFLPASDASAWRLRQGANDYINIDTIVGEVQIDQDLVVAGEEIVQSTLAVRGSTQTFPWFGTTSPVASRIQLDASSLAIGQSIEQYTGASTGFHAPVVVMARGRGTRTAPTAVALNDWIGTIYWTGHDGGDFETAASISVNVTGTPAADSVPASMLFSTTPVGAQFPSERLRIRHDGPVIAAAVPIAVGSMNTTTRDAFSPQVNGMIVYNTDGGGQLQARIAGNWATIALAGLDHGTLAGLADDDHTQYALLAGRGTGQTLIGGVNASNDLTLQSTSNGTRGLVRSTDRFQADNGLTVVMPSSTVLFHVREAAINWLEFDVSTGEITIGDSLSTQDIIFETGALIFNATPGTSGQVLTSSGAGVTPAWTTPATGVTDHGALTGLADDDHTQYALLAGRAGGQTLIGGTAASDPLAFRSTSNATRGPINFEALSTSNVDVDIYYQGGDGTNQTRLRTFYDSSANTVTYTIEEDVAGNGSFAAVATPIFAFAGTTPQLRASTSEGTFDIMGNRTAGSASADVRIGSSVGRTAGNLLIVRNNVTNRLTVGYSGQIDVIGGAISVAGASAFLCTPGDWTSQTAGVESIAADWNLGHTVTHNSNTLIPTNRDFVVRPSVHAFGTAGGVIRDGATLVVVGPPAAGANASITNPMAFWTQAGLVQFGSTQVADSDQEVRFAGGDGTNQVRARSILDSSANTFSQTIEEDAAGNHVFATVFGTYEFGGQLRFTQAASGTTSIVQGTADSTITIIGNRTGGSSGDDVVLRSSATRTVGNILSVQEATTERFAIDFAGSILHTGDVYVSGARNAFRLSPGAWSGQTAGTDINTLIVNPHTVTHASNTAIPTQRDYLFGVVTHAFATAGGVIRDGATLVVAGPPAPGANASITNPFSLWTQAGAVQFGSTQVADSDQEVRLAGGDGTNQLRTRAYLDASADNSFYWAEQDTAGDHTYLLANHVWTYGRPNTGATTADRDTTFQWWWSDGSTERVLELIAGPSRPTFRMPSASANGLSFANAAGTTTLLVMDAQNNICTFSSGAGATTIRGGTTTAMTIERGGAGSTAVLELIGGASRDTVIEFEDPSLSWWVGIDTSRTLNDFVISTGGVLGTSDKLILGSNGSASAGGDSELRAGDGVGTNQAGGWVTIQGGAATGTGLTGGVSLSSGDSANFITVGNDYIQVGGGGLDMTVQLGGSTRALIDSAGATELQIGELSGGNLARILVQRDLWLKTHSAFANSQVRRFTGAVQTTNATATNLLSTTMVASAVAWVECRIVGRDTAEVERAVYFVRALVYRNGTGNATFGAGSPSIDFSDESAAGLAGTLTVSTTALNVQVTGLASTTINWACELIFQPVSGNA